MQTTRICEIVSYLPVIGLMMTLSAIPFGWSDYQRICLLILGIGYVLDYVVNHRWDQLTWDRSKLVYIVMLFLFFLPLLWQLFDPTPPTEYFYHQVHRNEWMAYVGIVGLLGFSPKLKFKYVTFVLMLTSLVMGGYCVYLYFGAPSTGDMIHLDRFDYLRQTYINSHMVMNLYMNTAIIFALASIKDSTKFLKSLLIICIVLVMTFILLSNGRVGIMTMIVIICLFLFGLIYRLNKLLCIPVLLLILALIGAATLMNPRLNIDCLSKDARFAIWDYSWRMIKEKPICGYGYSTLSQEYVENAYKDGVMYHGFVKYLMGIPKFAACGKTMWTHHPHNAFMMYWLAMGIFGVIGLIALFVVSAALPIGCYRPYLWLFLLALFLQCMSEPIGDHILPQFFCIILLIWQLTPKIVK